MLQIQDPTKDNPPVVVGIDFGTTNSLIAFCEDRRPYILGQNSHLIPSVLYYLDDRWHVGHAPLGTLSIASIKRILGKTYSQAISCNSIANQVKDLLVEDCGALKIKILDQLFEPIYLASLIFKKLIDIAKQHLAQDIAKAVVTVPAYFDDIQKADIKKAAQLAGLEVIRLLSEPTSAGLTYGVNYATNAGTLKSNQYVVYDFGGGTFDVSLLKIEDKITQVIGVCGDATLGGDDIDRAICLFIKQKYGTLLMPASAKLLKEQGSCLDDKGLKISLSQEELAHIALPFVQKTIDLTRQILSCAQNASGIILIGGSSRLNLVKQLLAQFDLPLLDDIDPDKAVALGAALQGENLSRSKSHVLLDVVALSLGIEVIGGLNEKIILRNSPIPSCAKMHFTTYADNQTAFKLHILQGEREFAKDCISLGIFELSGIAPMPAGMVKIEVSFMLDADGLLYVSATEEATQATKELIVSAHSGLADEKTNQIVSDAIAHMQADHEARILQEAILKGNNFITKVNNLLVKFEQVDEKITQAVSNLQHSINQQSAKSIEKAISALDEVFSPVCAKYFNQQISSLLKGNKIL